MADPEGEGTATLAVTDQMGLVSEVADTLGSRGPCSGR
jgi:hypothetical protein